MYAVIGLGNPGEKYARTRHNAGHMLIDVMAERAGGSLKAHRASGTHALGARMGEERVILATCDSYMNTSGGPVKKLLDYYKVAPENLIVIHDDLDLPFGTVKLKRGGGEGGHNGLKSISSTTGTKNYIRLRLGIGRPPGRQDAADYVLRPFSSAERADLPTLLERGADAIEDVIAIGLDKATTRLHSL
ncbi:aminoacyl-tRNA hydrolase [Ancrocorticia populi]|uniref:Peptidyl-tRNA hydrolase n=1 Tax=Ancrocorticia populi TaxID=2175228 RepID=A0A2V1K926_9ACTO|nr:aminoacyl-tRNA hydrolase [Ancrocorticia populi]MDN6486307.1 aminoacyl-tRNA hydrolase [Ancrocorticia sp.]PWF27272.1 aminoacyl-tRNA hydrolase [Ancrocorticia populi]